MGIIWTIIFGIIVGTIAKFIMPGKDPGGFIVTVLLGIGGAIVARWLGLQMGAYVEGEPAGFIASVVGALIILAVYRMVVRRRV